MHDVDNPSEWYWANAGGGLHVLVHTRSGAVLKEVSRVVGQPEICLLGGRKYFGLDKAKAAAEAEYAENKMVSAERLRHRAEHYAAT